MFRHSAKFMHSKPMITSTYLRSFLNQFCNQWACAGLIVFAHKMCILNQWLPSSKLRLWLVVAAQLKFKKHREFSTIIF